MRYLKNAPSFYEIKDEIKEILDGSIFVAHNVRFDYSFVTEEYFNLGYTYTRKQLCTIKLFKKIFPGLKSYGLGNLIKHFEIEVESRHRAMADVKATYEIMQMALAQTNADTQLEKVLNESIRDVKYPQAVKYDIINNLPEKTGIYFFYVFLLYLQSCLLDRQRLIMRSLWNPTSLP